jgi:hypothetical protein
MANAPPKVNFYGAMMRRPHGLCKPQAEWACAHVLRIAPPAGIGRTIRPAVPAAGCVDPKEKLAVVYLSAAPGPIRWHGRRSTRWRISRSSIGAR